jgi:hypothetical protein
MDKSQFEKIKLEVNRKKSIYALKSKIEDYQFKIIEYEMTIKTLKEELKKSVESLEVLEKEQ